jgi:hypothetical protein
LKYNTRLQNLQLIPNNVSWADLPKKMLMLVSSGGHDLNRGASLNFPVQKELAMVIKVFIKRHIKESKMDNVLALLQLFRSNALKQPGYINGIGDRKLTGLKDPISNPI